MTYGRIVCEQHETKRVWVITCEPHVSTRLKRIFARVDQKAAKCIVLADTHQNCRDLAWFLERYPMELSDRDRCLLEERGCQHQQIEARVAGMLEGREPLPSIELAVPARDYQVYAAHMLTLRNGLLLADEVGVGKTTSAICALALEENLPALVVCPTHMPSHWVYFLKRFAPQLHVHVLKKGTPYPLTKSQARSLFPDRMPDVIISNYHKMRGWGETLAGQVKLVVYDECQHLRSPESMIYAACKLISDAATKRLGLSATPFYNYGGEIYHVMECLLPDALGTHEEFKREWCCNSYSGKPRLEKPNDFGAFMRREGLMLRRSRKDVGREMPAAQKIPHWVDCDPDMLKKLTGDAVALARTILAQTKDGRGERMNAAGQFDTLMRQATGIAKAPYVAEFVRMLLENGEKVLLFGWHRSVYDIWLDRLKEFHPAFYTGHESTAQKERSKQAFLKGETPLLIMSLRSGEGVDGLQEVCSTAVFGELDWSPGVMEQDLGRLDRDGQQSPVVGYFLTSDEGCDPIMMDVLGIKRDQIEGIREPEKDLIVRLESGDHIQDLARHLLAKRGLQLELA